MDAPGALDPFLHAVAAQVAGHRATPGAAAAAHLDAARADARAVVHERDADTAARCLLRDPPLLAAFFQNADLLFEHDSEFANPISAIVMRALELIGGDA